MMDIWKNIKNSYKTISDKTNELTKIGRIKLEILALKRDLEKHFIELGGRVYEMYNDGKISALSEDESFANLVNKIKDLENQLDLLRKKLEKIKQEEGVDLD